MPEPSLPVLGLGANRRQFALLVAVNAFVGAMVGLERSILPLLAEREFGLGSTAVAVSFIASFAVAKALANLFAGSLSERFSRRRVLIFGWLLALPVPFMIIWAPSWGWVIAANLFLGLNQGLAWSMTVNMKLDLVGRQRRGLALGFNESAGYLSVAGAAFLAGIVAEQYGIRPEPFYIGIGIAAAGLALSALFVRDTARFVELEARENGAPAAPALSKAFADGTWRVSSLVGVNQAGFVKNLNDALAWGIFPIFFAAQGLTLSEIGILAAVYPLIWAVLQIPAGWASDITGRKPFIVSGMLAQAAAISSVALLDSFGGWMASVALLGVGTAMVYPTLQAAISDEVHPLERATSVSVYRFWRDSGAICGALLAGAVADTLGMRTAIQVVAAITAASGLVAAAILSGRPAGTIRQPAGGHMTGR